MPTATVAPARIAGAVPRRFVDAVRAIGMAAASVSRGFPVPLASPASEGHLS